MSDDKKDKKHKKDKKKEDLEETLLKNKLVKKRRIKEHNQAIMRKMQEGESLTSFDSMASWFPPRPTVEKDQNLMDRLYNKKESKQPTIQMEKKKPTDQSYDKGSADKKVAEGGLKPENKRVEAKRNHLRQVK